VSVLDYLKIVFGEEPLKKCQHLADWEIGFTHFIPIVHKPSPIILENAFERNAAIICKRNQKGDDIILSMRHKDTKQFSTICIQVK
jgi:hypothetical protein